MDLFATIWQFMQLFYLLLPEIVLIMAGFFLVKWVLDRMILHHFVKLELLTYEVEKQNKQYEMMKAELQKVADIQDKQASYLHWGELQKQQEASVWLSFPYLLHIKMIDLLPQFNKQMEWYKQLLAENKVEETKQQEPKLKLVISPLLRIQRQKLSERLQAFQAERLLFMEDCIEENDGYLIHLPAIYQAEKWAEQLEEQSETEAFFLTLKKDIDQTNYLTAEEKEGLAQFAAFYESQWEYMKSIYIGKFENSTSCYLTAYQNGMEEYLQDKEPIAPYTLSYWEAILEEEKGRKAFA